MNCSDCEQLFDAYLDGQLSGTLRLEFDAHRLRCRHCQQTVAMLETIGHVVAAEDTPPELPASFATDVVGRIERRQKHRSRRVIRLTLVSATVLQAAAVLVLAILFAGQDEPPPVPMTAETALLESGASPELTPDPSYKAIQDLIRDRVEDRVWEMHAAGKNLTTDFLNVARYLNVMLPQELARESERIAEVNPWQGLWDGLVPSDEEEVETTTPDGDIHSI
jgi:hypothetical protein